MAKTEVFESKDIQSEPSYEPATEDSPAIAYEYVTKNLLKQTSVCIPAIVEEYDRKKNIVTVQPAIQESTSIGQYIKRAKIKAPVMQTAGGGFIVSFPLKKGDTGWLLTSDRDISLFKQQKTVINPNTYRSHSIEDSFFIPDYVSGFGEEKINEENIVLRSIKGATEVVVGKDKINLTIAQKKEKEKEGNNKSEELKTQIQISLDTIQQTGKKFISECENKDVKITKELKAKCPKITIDGACAIESNSTITIKSSKVTINGDLDVSGRVKANSVEASTVRANSINGGSISGDSVEGGGISLSGHTHGGVEPGSGNTGAPQ